MASEVPQGLDHVFVDPLPQPTLGAGGVATVVSSAHIDAPLVRCLEILLDTSTYPAWNKFVPHVDMQKTSEVAAEDLPASLAHLASGRDTHLLPGAKFCFECHMDPESPGSRPTNLEVTVLQDFVHEGRKGIRVAWKMQGGGMLMHAERTQEFVEAANGGTDYYNKETFYGIMAYAMKWFVGSTLPKALDTWKYGLKAEAEKSA